MPSQKTKIFQEKWLEAVEKQNSILCAGLDPAEAGMGRGEKGLPKETDKQDWVLEYIEAVAPYCAALKPNINYWKGRGDSPLEGDMIALDNLVLRAHDLGLVVIEDSKLADIGSTNDAGFFYAQEKLMDAVTFSPFAGNMQEATEQAHARNLGIISMCLMSNPEFEREKNKLVDISDDPVSYNEGTYSPSHVTYLPQNEGRKPATPHIRQYIQLAHDANKFGVDGIVVGAPSSKNHIQEHEVERIARYYPNGLLLVPGVGAQGGEAEMLFKYFKPENLMINIGRALMLPKGSASTPKQQAETAKQYRDMLNELRANVA